MKTKLLIIFLAASVLSSCSRVNKNNDDYLQIFPLREKKTEIKLNDLFFDFDFISLETSENSLIGSINKLIVNKNLIFILDKSKAKKIFVFNKEGKFIRTIGKIGKGPHEYTNIEDFTINQETGNLAVLAYPSKLLEYDQNGNFIRQKKLSKEAILWNICSYQDGYICSSNHQSVLKGEDAFLLFQYNKEFKLKNRFIDVLANQVKMPPFISSPLLNYQNQVAYFDSFTSNLYLGTNTSKMKTIRFNFEDKNVPQEAYAKPQDFFMNQNKYSFFLDLILTNDKFLSCFTSNGRLYVLILNLNTLSKSVYEYNDWFPKLLFYDNGIIYSTTSALSFQKDYQSIIANKNDIYPINENSNPVILLFNEKNLIKE